MKRTISFALACLLLAGTLSCGGESGTTDTTAAVGKLVCNDMSTDFASYLASFKDSVNQQYRELFDKIASFD